MSEAFLVRRGGSGGGLSPNSAVIHVSVPVGSTISFSKGGVVTKVLGPEKSHVNADDNTLADWYYEVSSNNYGTWTVTATLATDTASDTVTIDSNKQYDLELSYKLYLIKDGVFTSAYTRTLYGHSSATWTEELGYAKLYVSRQSSSFSTGYFSNIDVTNYLYIVCESSTHGYSNDSQYCPGVGVINALNKNNNPTTFTAWAKLMSGGSTNANTEGTFTVDISSITGTNNIGIQVAGSETVGTTGQCNCYNLYLSKMLPSNG